MKEISTTINLDCSELLYYTPAQAVAQRLERSWDIQVPKPFGWLDPLITDKHAEELEAWIIKVALERGYNQIENRENPDRTVTYEFTIREIEGTRKIA